LGSGAQQIAHCVQSTQQPRQEDEKLWDEMNSHLGMEGDASSAATCADAQADADEEKITPKIIWDTLDEMKRQEEQKEAKRLWALLDEMKRQEQQEETERLWALLDEMKRQEEQEEQEETERLWGLFKNKLPEESDCE
jgi:hypothetical protein